MCYDCYYLQCGNCRRCAFVLSRRYACVLYCYTVHEEPNGLIFTFANDMLKHVTILKDKCFMMTRKCWLLGYVSVHRCTHRRRVDVEMDKILTTKHQTVWFNFTGIGRVAVLVI